MSNFKCGWYVIYTRPKHEKKICNKLAENDINHFLPTTRALRTWWDRKKYVEVPLFPSYAFVFLNNVQEYYDVLAVEGVLYFVKFGKEISMVRQHIIDSLKMVLSRNENVEVSDTRFRPGRQMVIPEGIFAGFPCEIVEYKNEQKLIVRISLLNTNVLASVPPELAYCAEAS